MLNNQLLRVKLLMDPKVVEETLSRMGIADSVNKKLYQSCYLFKAWGDYYIVHFKQMFKWTYKNGEPGFGNVSQEDMNRRDSIAYCLKQWKMVDFDENEIDGHDTRIFVVPYKEKYKWQCIPKIDMRNIEIPDNHF